MKTDLPSILVIDDQEPILEGFQKLLDVDAYQSSDASISLDQLEAALGGSTPSTVTQELPTYDMHYARQGLEGVRMCEHAIARGKPLSVAFVDVHMPPGMDGVETAIALWKLQPDLEIVLCTAHAIYSWQEILAKVPRRDQLVILRKPFDAIEVRQLAACLGEKTRRGRELALRMAQLEARVESEVGRRLEIELAHHQKFEELGRLAAGIAHEISTPAQYIQSSLDFLDELVTEMIESPLQATPLEDLRTAVNDATHGVGRITAIVRSVREYSHTSSEAEPLDLNHQIRMAAELARSQYKYDAELELDLAEVPVIKAHADELGRAIMNLLINAAHAIRAKGAGVGKITIATRAAHDSVSVSITDTGTGIAPEHREKVFEPFFTTKPRGEGTGQGLPLVRATVERHGGTLRFETAQGVGTTFILSFPVEGRAVIAA
jgi:two-component system NtrC family sensor kinase